MLSNKKKSIASVFILLVAAYAYGQRTLQVKSPDGNTILTVGVRDVIEYSVSQGGEVLLEKSPISMTLHNGSAYGINGKLDRVENRSVVDTIRSPIYKRKHVADRFNEMTLYFEGAYCIVFRAYDDGVAYRFVSLSTLPFEVADEQAVFNFPDDHHSVVPFVRTAGYHKDNLFEEGSFEDQYFKSFVNTYSFLKLSEWDKERLALPPLVVATENGRRLCITEADLLHYPGMYLYNPEGTTGFKGHFAPYPKTVKRGGFNDIQGVVTEREPYIAKYSRGTHFPWRILIIANHDHELIDNDMVYRLATPNKLSDISWVKPGKVAWEWWNDHNLSGVDFETGINNQTYKYYIDFAAANGIEYVILDEGWSDPDKPDLFTVVDQIDLEELVDHGASKGVGIMLWAGYYPFEKDLEAVCKHYASLGVKGFKIDFMDRDDQLMVEFHHRAAQVAAKYRLLVNFHGTYKPTGLQRTYPNAITFEAVQGLEHMKWTATQTDQVTHDVTIPFIRMVAGPLDYTPGAMRNATRENYRSIYSEPMSQGTRCRQLAQYVVFESPLAMLSDSPVNYVQEQECTDFIVGIPTTWDDTHALGGEIGKYVSIARRKGDEWYVGAMTNWDARTITLDLSFLGAGHFKAEVYRDGVNANRIASDYAKQVVDIAADRRMKITMAPGGGYAMRIWKSDELDVVGRVLAHDALVAFWDFAPQPSGWLESRGQAPYRLVPSDASILQVAEGPLSGYALALDGKSQYLSIPHVDSHALDVRSGQVTVMAWVKWHGGTGFVAGKWNEYQDGGRRQYGLFVSLPYYNGRNQVCGHISQTGGPTDPFPFSMDYSASRQQVPKDEWVCVAFTYDGTYIKSYLNGLFEPREPEPIQRTAGFLHDKPNGVIQVKNPYFYPYGIGSNASDFTVGAVQLKNGMGNFFNGKIGGIAVFNKALSEKEMKDLAIQPKAHRF